MSQITQQPRTAPVDIVRVDEPWATAYLADGTEVRVKVVFEQVSRVLAENGKPAFNPDGSPQYQIKMQNVMGVDKPKA